MYCEKQINLSISLSIRKSINKFLGFSILYREKEKKGH